MLATFGAVSAHAQTSIALPGERVFPENIAASRDGTVYVGSVGQGGVYRIEPHGKEAKVWIKPGAFGTHSIFGVLADDKSNTLWVCSNDLSARGVTLSGSDGVSALKGFDLKTGEGKISAALPGKPATCNDITIGPDGSAFVSNTAAPQILRLAPGAKELEVWFTDPSLQPATGAGLDGLAFGRDGNLYITSFRSGTDPTDNDKVMIFRGPQGPGPGAKVGQIDLDQAGGDRAFAQALLFGPRGRLFVPISGNGADSGQVRRYDVAQRIFDIFVPTNPTGGLLVAPQYLTFGRTNPATLEYGNP